MQMLSSSMYHHQQWEWVVWGGAVGGCWGISKLPNSPSNKHPGHIPPNPSTKFRIQRDSDSP